MTFAKITATESPAMPLSNISNLPLTPERARRWSDTTHRVLSDLQTGTRACHMIIGEDVESEDLMNRQDKINDAKIQVVQRELITECYKMLGHAKAEVSESDENVVGRNHFYNGFLERQHKLLETFLEENCPPSATLELPDFLKMLDPAGILKGANAMVHEITFNDVRIALELLQEKDVTAARFWEHLVVFLTDDEDIMDRTVNRTETKVKKVCKEKQSRLQSSELRKEAEKFQDKRLESQQKKMYGKLEKRGLVVSNATLDKRLKEMEERIVERMEERLKCLDGLDERMEERIVERMEERFRCLDGLDERIEEQLKKHLTRNTFGECFNPTTQQVMISLVAVSIGIAIMRLTGR